jgi:hypothetical protein
VVFNDVLSESGLFKVKAFLLLKFSESPSFSLFSCKSLLFGVLSSNSILFISKLSISPVLFKADSLFVSSASGFGFLENSAFLVFFSPSFVL